MKTFKTFIAESADVYNNMDFWNWFGDSKIVDDEGMPLVLYHGCAFPDGFQDKAVFSSKFKNDVGNDWGDAILGHFFTSSHKVANSFSGNDGMNMQVFLKMENPYHINGEEFYTYLQDWSGKDFKWLRKDVISNGHDGIIISEWPKAYRIMAGWIQFIAPTYIVFNPNQIKSATGNNGKYAKHPDITR